MRVVGAVVVGGSVVGVGVVGVELVVEEVVDVFINVEVIVLLARFAVVKWVQSIYKYI